MPRGDVELQRLVHQRLDGDLAWLEQRGARVVERSTGNPRTTGVRFDTRSLTEALARQAGEIRLDDALRELPERGPVVLATGGFQASRELVREWITPEADKLFLRATPWSTGDGLALGRAAGASTTSGLDEFYGRNMPAPPARITEAQLVPLAQLYAHYAVIEDTRASSTSRDLVRDRRRPVDCAAPWRACDLPDPGGAPWHPDSRAYDR